MNPPIEQVRERLADITLALCRIPSVTGQEGDIAAYFERWAKSRTQWSHDDIVREGNALVIGQPDGHRPAVALVGHLDTVPGPTGEPSPYRDGDRLIGLGASDMKGALAVILVLMETLPQEQLAFDPVVVLYDKEEGPYQQSGLGPLLERHEMLEELDLAIVMEPTNNTLQLGCLGGIQARVTYKGKAAHSARPWQGDNAIHKAAGLLTALEKRQANEVRVGGLIFRESTSVTMAKGGQSRNIIPDRFELNVNYRFAPNNTAERALADLKQLAGNAEIEVLDNAPPGAVPEHNELLEHLRTLGQLSIEPKEAWTDVARLSARGIDAANFGPGSTAQAHQRGEWASHNALCQAYDILWRFFTTPLGKIR